MLLFMLTSTWERHTQKFPAKCMDAWSDYISLDKYLIFEVPRFPFLGHIYKTQNKIKHWDAICTSRLPRDEKVNPNSVREMLAIKSSDTKLSLGSYTLVAGSSSRCLDGRVKPRLLTCDKFITLVSLAELNNPIKLYVREWRMNVISAEKLSENTSSGLPELR
jgi:hypothetical protein